MAGNCDQLPVRVQGENSEPLKRCCKCLEMLSLGRFANDRSRSDGKSSRCRACRRKHYLADVDGASRQAREWADRNRDHVRSRNLKYYQENKAAAVVRMADWYERNKDRVAENVRRYREDHPGFIAAKQAKRRASLVQATPIWACKEKIDAIYRLAGEMGGGHEVDHIVPLNSRRVCGLHCEANLRIISADENRRKSNRWWPDMFDR